MLALAGTSPPASAIALSVAVSLASEVAMPITKVGKPAVLALVIAETA